MEEVFVRAEVAFGEEDDFSGVVAEWGIHRMRVCLWLPALRKSALCIGGGQVLGSISRCC